MVGLLRSAATRLTHTPAAQAVDRSQQALVAFNRGYRYAVSLRSPCSPRDRVAPVTALEEYFDCYGDGPGLWKWRHYFDIYERHLSRFRLRPVRLLEVGVFGGGSLKMWRDYLGPECRLYGVDIDPSSMAYQAEGTTIYIGDQADPAFWREVLTALPEVDVVVDDGGHRAHQQITTLEALLPHIAPGGVYICEDILDAMHPFHSYIDGFTRPLSAISAPEGRTPASCLHEHVASVHRYPLVTVIEKPAHCVTHFEAPKRGTEWPTNRVAIKAPLGRWAAGMMRLDPRDRRR